MKLGVLSELDDKSMVQNFPNPGQGILYLFVHKMVASRTESKPSKIPNVLGYATTMARVVGDSATTSVAFWPIFTAVYKLCLEFS
jgi:hypothetical protein